MNVRIAASVFLSASLLSGCGTGGPPADEPSAAASTNAAAPVASASVAPLPAPEPSAPLLKAASYPPRDECGNLPGWADFRAKLEQAVAQRDADGLAALADANIELDFGGGHGVKEMRKRLDDKDYKLWDQIDALLPLGCAAQGDTATLPWIFARSPEDADPYSGMLVLGADVPARTKPDADAPALTTLNWPIVTYDGEEAPDPAFTKVTLPGGGKTAFVESTKLRGLIDYRLIANRTKQGWRITALIVGD